MTSARLSVQGHQDLPIQGGTLESQSILNNTPIRALKALRTWQGCHLPPPFVCACLLHMCMSEDKLAYVHGRPEADVKCLPLSPSTLVLLLLVLFLRQRVSKCRVGWSEAPYVDQTDLKLRTSCLFLLRAGNKGLYHHAWLPPFFFETSSPMKPRGYD